MKPAGLLRCPVLPSTLRAHVLLGSDPPASPASGSPGLSAPGPPDSPHSPGPAHAWASSPTPCLHPWPSRPLAPTVLGLPDSTIGPLSPQLPAVLPILPMASSRLEWLQGPPTSGTPSHQPEGLGLCHPPGRPSDQATRPLIFSLRGHHLTVASLPPHWSGVRELLTCAPPPV